MGYHYTIHDDTHPRTKSQSILSFNIIRTCQSRSLSTHVDTTKAVFPSLAVPLDSELADVMIAERIRLIVGSYEFSSPLCPPDAHNI